MLPIVLCGLVLFLLARRERHHVAAARAPSQRRAPAGVQAAPPESRQARDHGIGGWVLDPRDDAPIAGAMVTLLGPGEVARSVPLQSSGRFEVSELPPGRWTVRVEAEGYVPGEAHVTVPHRGQWRAMTLRLDSLRALALAPFRRIAMRLLPSTGQWSVQTNREVLDRARDQGLPTGPLESLASEVEQAYYAAEPPTRTEVQAIEHHAQRALAEMEERQRAATGGRH
jgi:hypothetical protein